MKMHNPLKKRSSFAKHLKIKHGLEDLIHKAKMTRHVDYNNLASFVFFYT
jgi:hypothetical protein